MSRPDWPSLRAGPRVVRGIAAQLRLAKVVHAADIASDLNNDAIAPGLEAIATGFGIILPDDQANLQAQFVVYDALYAWCRLQVV